MIEQACLHLCRVVTGVQARWRCELPENQQRVYFANHSSNLDLPVIWSSLSNELRGQTRPVAAADYWQKTKARRYLAENVFRALLIDRQGSGRLAAFNKMLEALDQGSSLIIFPEGTRTPGHEISDFKSGLFVLPHIWRISIAYCPRASGFSFRLFVV
jgi:1-acyl-sn-glycerol-3-phosphate acyltransferase